MIHVAGRHFELVKNFHNGWNLEAFRSRYNDILNKYDFIVGDWGYGQLRLKGFYHNSNPKAPLEQKIGQVEDYLREYCNFGCPYFILRDIERPPHPPKRREK
jgi:uncharacterized protein YutD